MKGAIVFSPQTCLLLKAIHIGASSGDSEGKNDANNLAQKASA